MHRASEAEMGELHGLVARHLVEKLKSGDMTAADLNAAIKFLKDNGIDCVPGHNPDMQTLIAGLPDYSPPSGDSAVHPPQ